MSDHDWLRQTDVVLNAQQQQCLASLLTRLKVEQSSLLSRTLQWQLLCWQMRDTLQRYVGQKRGNSLFRQCFQQHFPDVPLPPLLRAIGKGSCWFALAFELTTDIEVFEEATQMFDRLLTQPRQYIATSSQQQQQQCPTATSFEKLGPEISHVRSVLRERGANGVALSEKQLAEQLLKELHECLWSVCAEHLKPHVQQRYPRPTTGSEQQPQVESFERSLQQLQQQDEYYFWNHLYRAKDAHALSSPNGWLTDECINIIGGLLWRQAMCEAILAGGSHSLWLSSFFYSKLCSNNHTREQMQRYLEKGIAEYATIQQRLAGEMGVDATEQLSPPPKTLSGFAQVFIPLHVRQSHWVLAVLRPQERSLTLYDSLRMSATADDNSSCAETLAQFFGGVLQQGQPLISADHVVQFVIDEAFPQQSNSADCGIYLLRAVEHWLSAIPKHAGALYGLNADGARRARHVWSAWLKNPQLHLPGVLQAEWCPAEDTHSLRTNHNCPPAAVAALLSVSSPPVVVADPFSDAMPHPPLVRPATSSDYYDDCDKHAHNINTENKTTDLEESSAPVPPAEISSAEEQQAAQTIHHMERRSALRRQTNRLPLPISPMRRSSRKRHLRSPSSPEKSDQPAASIAIPFTLSSPAPAQELPNIPCLPESIVDGIPLDIFAWGLASWKRNCHSYPAPFRQALDLALSDLMWRLADTLNDGELLKIPEFQQAKRNESRASSAAYNAKLEGERTMRILFRLVERRKAQLPLIQKSCESPQKRVCREPRTESIASTPSRTSSDHSSVDTEEASPEHPASRLSRFTRHSLRQTPTTPPP